jgi:hypothetical protein
MTPTPVHCSFTVDSGGNVIATYPEFAIPKGGADQLFFSVPTTFSGIVYIDLTCRHDTSSGEPGNWQLGPITVDPATWTLTAHVSVVPGRVDINIVASMNATCQMVFTYPPGIVGPPVTVTMEVDYREGIPDQVSLGVVPELSGTATADFSCVDHIGRSHTMSQSFEIIGAPTDTSEPPATSAPSDTPVPTPTSTMPDSPAP